MPSAEEFDPSNHLNYGDVRVNNREHPFYLEIRMNVSKTDVFRKGVTLYLGKTGCTLCPVAAVLGYMALCNQSNTPAPLFNFKNGAPLTRKKLVNELRKALAATGINAENYTGYSFRIGAASTAAACGMPESLIKTLGRWESAAYMLYIRTLWSTLCSVVEKLAKCK